MGPGEGVALSTLVVVRVTSVHRDAVYAGNRSASHCFINLLIRVRRPISSVTQSARSRNASSSPVVHSRGLSSMTQSAPSTCPSIDRMGMPGVRHQTERVDPWAPIDERIEPGIRKHDAGTVRDHVLANRMGERCGALGGPRLAEPLRALEELTMLVDERQQGSSRTEDVRGEPREPIEGLFRRRIEQARLVQRHEPRHIAHHAEHGILRFVHATDRKSNADDSRRTPTAPSPGPSVITAAAS